MTFLILPLFEQVIVVFLELCVTFEVVAACVTTGDGVGVGVALAVGMGVGDGVGVGVTTGTGSCFSLIRTVGSEYVNPLADMKRKPFFSPMTVVATLLVPSLPRISISALTGASENL